MIAQLYNQIQEILVQQPYLRSEEKENEFTLRGNYKYCLEYKGVIIQGSREIEFVIPKRYPLEIPLLYILKAPKGMEHVYPDKSVCLATTGELYKFLFENHSLKSFIEKFVDSFIFSTVWFEKYGIYPFGEREHGYKGLLNYYLSDWNLNEKQYKNLIWLVYKRQYRGHLNCICGSGKKLRNCHGNYIFPIIKNDEYRKCFLNEAICILENTKNSKLD